MTPRQLYDWACESIQATSFGYCTSEEYENEHSMLQKRFEKCRTIPGTRKLHSFVPLSVETLEVRTFSASTGSKLVKVVTADSELPFDKIKGFVTCVYDGHWWLACVLETNTEGLEVKLSFLHPNGPTHSFRYPHIPDILWVPASNVLTIVDPRTTTGRIYTITQSESKAATGKLHRTS